MADRIITAGTTDVTVQMRFWNALTGAPATGLTIANIDIKIYRLDDDNDVELVQDWTDLTALGALTTVHTNNYGIEMDSGYYRVDLPDAACQAGTPKGLETVILARSDAGTVILESSCTLQLISVDLNTALGSQAVGSVTGAVGSVAATVTTDTASRTASKASAADVGGAEVDLTKINGAAQTATLDTLKAETVLIVEDTGTTIPATLSTIGSATGTPKLV